MAVSRGGLLPRLRPHRDAYMKSTAPASAEFALQRLLSFDRRHPEQRLSDIAMRSAALVSHTGSPPSAFTAALLSPLIKAGRRIDARGLAREAGGRAVDTALLVPDALIVPSTPSEPWRERAHRALETLTHRPILDEVWTVTLSEHLAALSVLSEGTHRGGIPRALLGIGAYAELDDYLFEVARAPRAIAPEPAALGERLEEALRAWQRERLACARAPQGGVWKLDLEGCAGAERRALYRALFESAGVPWREAPGPSFLFMPPRDALDPMEFRLLVAALRLHCGQGRVAQLPEDSGQASGWADWSMPCKPQGGRVTGSRFLRLLRDPGVDDPIEAWVKAPQPEFGFIGRTVPAFEEAPWRAGQSGFEARFSEAVRRFGIAAATAAALCLEFRDEASAHIVYDGRTFTVICSGRPNLFIGRGGEESGPSRFQLFREGEPPRPVSASSLFPGAAAATGFSSETREMLRCTLSLCGMPCPGPGGARLQVSSVSLFPAGRRAELSLPSGQRLTIAPAEDNLHVKLRCGEKSRGEVLPALLWEWIEENCASPMDAFR